jgi:hypothetical protein
MRGTWSCVPALELGDHFFRRFRRRPDLSLPPHHRGAEGHACIYDSQGRTRHPATSISRAMARLSSPCLQDGTRRYRVKAKGFGLPFGTLARVAQEQEPGVRSGAAGRGGGLGPSLTGAASGMGKERGPFRLFSTDFNPPSPPYPQKWSGDTGRYSRSFGLSAPFASPPCGE